MELRRALKFLLSSFGFESFLKNYFLTIEDVLTLGNRCNLHKCYRIFSLISWELLNWLNSSNDYWKWCLCSSTKLNYKRNWLYRFNLTLPLTKLPIQLTETDSIKMTCNSSRQAFSRFLYLVVGEKSFYQHWRVQSLVCYLHC